MGYAPHQSLSATAGCRSCLKRQFGKKSPPRGSQVMRRNSDFERFITNCSLSDCPSSVAFSDSFPPRGSLRKRLTIFAEKK